MSGKKLNNKSKIVKLKPNNDIIPSGLFEDFLDEIMEQAGPSPAEADAITHLASSMVSSAIDLSKVIIENRVRNSQEINDDDIYEIYTKSFKSIMQSTEV
jgi:hypothetical protein